MRHETLWELMEREQFRVKATGKDNEHTAIIDALLELHKELVNTQSAVNMLAGYACGTGHSPRMNNDRNEVSCLCIEVATRMHGMNPAKRKVR